jgi:hypothetical protein
MKIHDDIRAAGNDFFFPSNLGAQVSTYARLLLPLKCLGYGVAPHAFCDYFQCSKSMAKLSMEEFDKAVTSLYLSEYLRKPTAEDLNSIQRLHAAKHKIKGMYGSLDCMHVPWKNCPKGWQQSYVGKEGSPTIVLEAVADYNLWFWHSFFGSGGNFNDLNVLDRSNLQKMFIDGTMECLERQSGATPFEIAGEVFSQLFLLVDGIYPPFSRFIRGMKDPLLNIDKVFTEWQESARKDIERAFGVLQSRFHWTRHPIMMHNPEGIVRRMKTILILHNMCVSDRIMNNDVNALYDPAFGLEDNGVNSFVVEGVNNIPEPSAFGNDVLFANNRWAFLTDAAEHQRLQNAVKRSFVSS